MKIELVTEPTDTLRRAIQVPLSIYNDAVGGPSGYKMLALAVRDNSGVICGGLWGHTAYGWLFTQLLAVPATARGEGLGRALMLAAETEARERGCEQAWVDTIFGARGFYEKLDYNLFGELTEHPPGFTRSFLKKSLI